MSVVIGVPIFTPIANAPLLENVTMVSGHIIVGTKVSSTVIFDVALPWLPFVSVTVKVTMLGIPTLLQENIFCESVISIIPQLSKEPPSTCTGVSGAKPCAFKYIVTS